MTGRWGVPMLLFAFAMLAAPRAVAPPGAAPVRAAYFYSYMPVAHLDSLAAHGFTRALAHTIADSLDARTRGEFRALAARAETIGVELVPQWLLQSAPRLAARPAARRYTWGPALTAEQQVACPLDTAYWRSALFDRAEDFLTVVPHARRLAVDLEVYRASRHHYDAGPCRCASCVAAYTALTPQLQGQPASALRGLDEWEESQLATQLAPMFAVFAQRHPGVAFDVFDLDLDSSVHRGLAKALVAAKVPTADYTERTYATGAASMAAAAERLRRVGLGDTTLVGGLWLKRWKPADLPAAMKAMDADGAGVFVFTTYSLWLDPAKLTGPYTLLGSPGDYWAALTRGSQP